MLIFIDVLAVLVTNGCPYQLMNKTLSKNEQTTHSPYDDEHSKANLTTAAEHR